MPKYLIRGNYIGDGVAGLAKQGGTARKRAVSEMLKSVGGKLDAFYYALGEDDVYAILDVPDNVSIAALSLVVNGSGNVNVTTTALLTPEEMDAAAKMTPKYRPPQA